MKGAMVCPKCGNKADAEDTFCRSCGYSLKASTGTSRVTTSDQPLAAKVARPSNPPKGWSAWEKGVVFSLIGVLAFAAAISQYGPNHAQRSEGEGKARINIGAELRLYSHTGGTGLLPLARIPEVIEELSGADSARIERMVLEGKFMPVSEGTLVRVVDSEMIGPLGMGLAYKVEIEEGVHRGEYAWVGAVSLSRILAAQIAHQVTSYQYTILTGALPSAALDVRDMLDKLSQERRRGDVRAVCSDIPALESRATSALMDINRLGFQQVPPVVEQVRSGFTKVKTGAQAVASACRPSPVDASALATAFATMASGKKEVDDIVWDKKKFDFQVQP
jgi:zinc ribbon protein